MEKSATKKKSADAGMAMPKPAAEMKELRALVGTWSTDETFEPSPFMPGGTATGINTVRLGPGGFTVLMDQRSKSTMGPFAGHGVLTWDPNEKAYKTVWADSMAPGVTVDTGHKEGDNIVYTGEMWSESALTTGWAEIFGGASYRWRSHCRGLYQTPIAA